MFLFLQSLQLRTFNPVVGPWEYKHNKKMFPRALQIWKKSKLYLWIGPHAVNLAKMSFKIAQSVILLLASFSKNNAYPVIMTVPSPRNGPITLQQHQWLVLDRLRFWNKLHTFHLQPKRHHTYHILLVELHLQGPGARRGHHPTPLDAPHQGFPTSL